MEGANKQSLMVDVDALSTREVQTFAEHAYKLINKFILEIARNDCLGKNETIKKKRKLGLDY